MRYLFVILISCISGLAFGQGQSREVMICRETTLHLKAESEGAVSYEWFRGSDIIDGEVTNALTVSEEGIYAAMGVNADGCTSGASVQIIVSFFKPSAVDDIGAGIVNRNLVLDVLENDQSNCAALDSASLLVVDNAAHGTISKFSGTFIYKPEKGYIGEDTFTYTVRDRSGQLSNVASVKIVVDIDPMPVLLSYFDVARNESVAYLKWGTAQEINSDHFEVQRSTDSENWSSIAQVKSAFETNTKTNYELTDSLPESGLNYYRLKMVDRDHTYTYSRIRSVHFPELSWAELYPNPVSDVLSIIVRNKKVRQLRIINTAGITMSAVAVKSANLLIDMKKYPLGAFLFHFEQDDGAVKVFKIFHN